MSIDKKVLRKFIDIPAVSLGVLVLFNAASGLGYSHCLDRATQSMPPSQALRYCIEEIEGVHRDPTKGPQSLHFLIVPGERITIYFYKKYHGLE